MPELVMAVITGLFEATCRRSMRSAAVGSQPARTREILKSGQGRFADALSAFEFSCFLRGVKLERGGAYRQ
jgi:hypothetical protein